MHVTIFIPVQGDAINTLIITISTHTLTYTSLVPSPLPAVPLKMAAGSGPGTRLNPHSVLVQ